MSNKLYDYLKWSAIILVPALATLVGTIGTAVEWEQTNLAVLIITALGTFLGTLLGVSNVKYNK